MLSEFSGENLLRCLPDGDPQVRNFVDDLLRGSYAGLCLIMYLRGLFGRRILDLYELCGYDLDRLHYHMLVELPDQRTGEVEKPLSPYLDIMGLRYDHQKEKLKHHLEARKFGKPGSLWALKDPPAEPRYDYPIYVVILKITIADPSDVPPE
jgi:hypothetical protein